MGKWTRIKPYGEDAYTYWISGIYKIVSYRSGEYLSFFIQDHYSNWGDYVSAPPADGENGKCWKTLAGAKDSCHAHAKHHAPAVKTVNRAAEIMSSVLVQAEEYREAA